MKRALDPPDTMSVPSLQWTNDVQFRSVPSAQELTNNGINVNQNATTFPDVHTSRTALWKSSVQDTPFSRTSRDRLAVRFHEAQNRKWTERKIVAPICK